MCDAPSAAVSSHSPRSRVSRMTTSARSTAASTPPARSTSATLSDPTRMDAEANGSSSVPEIGASSRAPSVAHMAGVRCGPILSASSGRLAASAMKATRNHGLRFPPSRTIADTIADSCRNGSTSDTDSSAPSSVCA